MDKKKYKIGYICGCFDLFHVGHLNVIKKSKDLCEYLVVGVHKDGTHKNKSLIVPFEDRKQIIEAIKYVDKVIDAPSEDIEAWPEIKYDVLFAGSDYKHSQRFEKFRAYLEPKNVDIVFFDYTQKVSSTMLRDKINGK